MKEFKEGEYVKIVNEGDQSIGLKNQVVKITSIVPETQQVMYKYQILVLKKGKHQGSYYGYAEDEIEKISDLEQQYYKVLYG